MTDDSTSPEITFVDLAEQPAAVVSARVPHQGIGDFLGTAFGEVLSELGRQDRHPAGPPFSRYRLLPEGEFEVQAGFPVDGPVEPADPVVPSTLPGGRAVRVVHRGAYDRVAQAYQAGQAWMQEHDHALNGDPWESYVEAPDVPDHRTEVLLPCAERQADPATP